MGAKVCIIQKEKEAAACGNFGAGIDLSKTSKADVEAVVSKLIENNEYRPGREVVRNWAYNSGEAITWFRQKILDVGGTLKDMGNDAQKNFLKSVPEHDVNFITIHIGPKPYNIGEALKDLTPKLLEEGVDIYFETEAKQLIMENGACKGVIAEGKEGNIEFRAKYGVVVGTGDYQNNDDMMQFFLPEMVNFEKKKTGRTGDGHKMISWAGGKIEEIGHTKMAHDFDSGPASMMSLPYMRVRKDGKRFCKETINMEYMNCFLQSKNDSGHYFQIFDADYEKAAEQFGAKAASFEEMRNYMPEEDVAERKAVIEDLINTWKADTLEELAEKLGIENKDEFISQVDRYNEYVSNGSDEEFGVEKKYLTPIKKAPFYGIHRHIKLTLACSGVVVDGDLQCLDRDGKKIEGLYAAGNTAGSFYGAIDYPLSIAGLNLGRNYTSDYYLGKLLANKAKENNGNR